jgi:hypothetical protein
MISLNTPYIKFLRLLRWSTVTWRHIAGECRTLPLAPSQLYSTSHPRICTSLARAAGHQSL